MKAMTIRQPWIHAILHEGKDIENRTWSRDFRGWIALHAASKPDEDATFPRGHKTPLLGSLDYSAICGLARVVDIVTLSRSKWFYKPARAEKNYGWVLGDVVALSSPVPCSGWLGLWEVPKPVMKKIRAQVSNRLALAISLESKV